METLNQYYPNVHVFMFHSFGLAGFFLYYNNTETLGKT